MNAKKPERQHRQPDPQRRIRRFSIFLILGVVAVIAIGLWVFSSWFSSHYYGDDKPLSDLPPPPSFGQVTPPAGSG